MYVAFSDKRTSFSIRLNMLLNLNENMFYLIAKMFTMIEIRLLDKNMYGIFN